MFGDNCHGEFLLTLERFPLLSLPVVSMEKEVKEKLPQDTKTLKKETGHLTIPVFIKK